MKFKDSTRRYLLAVTTFSSAMSIAFVMQESEARPAPLDTRQAYLTESTLQSGSALELTNIVETAALPQIPGEMALPPNLDAAPLRLAAAEDFTAIPVPAETEAPSLGCDINFQTEVQAAALVRLALVTDCLPNERVTLHHNGMMFTAATNSDGVLNIVVPALSENSVFLAAFANGQTVVAQTEVPTLRFYDRVVLQWRGASGLELHALEFGANYGDAGHVWRENPRELASIASGEGGFLTTVGDENVPDALRADVYTFPSGAATRDGIVVLSVESPVTETNCNQEISAQTIEIHNGNAPRVQDLLLAIPDCDGTGDFLVLKNLLEDLTIATNE